MPRTFWGIGVDNLHKASRSSGTLVSLVASWHLGSIRIDPSGTQGGTGLLGISALLE
jgi:hypothetical protein